LRKRRRNCAIGRILRACAWTVTLGTASAVFAGCRSAPGLTAQEGEGKRLYVGWCAHCHEENDLNLKKLPPDLHGVYRHVALPSGATATDAEVRRVVLAGKGMMPSFAGRFSDEQMRA